MTDHLFILKALDEIGFGVGRKLLIDFLTGNETNESIKRNRLFRKPHFASLAYEKDELNALIDNLLMNNLITTTSVGTNKFWKVLVLTDKGVEEIKNPKLHKKKLSYNFKETETEITEKDKQLFQAFDHVLGKYNQEQKKAITSNAKHILCIAGAGSGKTTVLTKRIEFLIRYKSVPIDKILAITFTRKARQEMIRRLGDSVNIQTFNSFCEGILKQYNDLIYDKPVMVISYKDKFTIINKALQNLNINMNRAIDIYFTYAQKRSKTNEQLANIFLNDCFFIRDYFKFKHKEIERAAFQSDTHEKSADLVFSVSKYIEAYMKKNGLRDFADQLIDTLALFNKHKELIPKYDHILVDEYQDVNSTQIKLIEALDPENLFAVGDPRQSIFGWRGSDIKHILKFEDRYPDCEIITLTKNYRSTKPIVDLINTAIKPMGLPALESNLKGEKEIELLNFKTEESEFQFIINSIEKSDIDRNEIFVLARTNRQLNELSNAMKIRNIKHIVRSDEMKRSIKLGEGEVTLATIHSIKGLEADTVFIIGCTANNFPCKGSEHPVIEMVRVDEYDKEEEERRLFYVGLSRAKRKLYLTYSTKSPTYFISRPMLDLLEEKKSDSKVKSNIMRSSDTLTRLKQWRTELSKHLEIPAYMIMHDRTLIDMAVKMPSKIEELEKVMGLGPAKISKYGEELLDIVNG